MVLKPPNLPRMDAIDVDPAALAFTSRRDRRWLARWPRAGFARRRHGRHGSSSRHDSRSHLSFRPSASGRVWSPVKWAIPVDSCCCSAPVSWRKACASAGREPGLRNGQRADGLDHAPRDGGCRTHVIVLHFLPTTFGRARRDGGRRGRLPSARQFSGDLNFQIRRSRDRSRNAVAPADWQVVTPGYFNAVGMRVVAAATSSHSTSRAHPEVWCSTRPPRGCIGPTAMRSARV